MEPILALTLARGVAGIVSSLVAPRPTAAPVRVQAPTPRGAFVKASAGGDGFASVLRDELGKQSQSPMALSFTKDASQKLEQLGVSLTQDQYDRLMEGVKEAASKGGKNSLVMMDGMAFTVDVTKGKITDVARRGQASGAPNTNIDTVVETKI